MIYESHNSFTYLQPRQWWLKPLAIFAKCQSLDFRQQYHAGVRCFDVRIRFDGYTPVVCHGVVEYQFPTGENINSALAWLAEKSYKDVQIAFRLESGAMTAPTSKNSAWSSSSNARKSNTATGCCLTRCIANAT